MSDTRFLDKIKNNKKITYVVVAILMFFCFYILSLNLTASTSDAEKDGSIYYYVSELEDPLSEILSSIEGAGKVKVAITIKSGMETVLAMKTTTTEGVNGKETVTTPIILNGKTVITKEIFPEITGVLIVAKGADKIYVKNKILQATSSLLDVNVNKIEILTMC